MDRLYASIRLGLIPEDFYIEDYLDLLKKQIAAYPDSFGPATAHRHMVHVHKSWSDGTKAADRAAKFKRL